MSGRPHPGQRGLRDGPGDRAKARSGGARRDLRQDDDMHEGDQDYNDQLDECHAQGYLNNPTANKEFFTEDGFAKMGDLGYYDEQGRLYFKDRIKEVIKVCHPGK